MRAHLGHNISQFLRVSGPFESTWCASQLKWESFPLYLFSKCWWHRKDLCQEWSLSHSHWDLDLFQAASTTSSGNFPIKSLHHKMGRITALYFPLDPKFAFQRACIDARAPPRGEASGAEAATTSSILRTSLMRPGRQTWPLGTLCALRARVNEVLPAPLLREAIKHRGQWILWVIHEC